MSQRFVRCAHCGLPHAIDEATCPITGRPIEARRSAGKPSIGARAPDPPSRSAPGQRSFDSPSQPAQRVAREPSSQPPPFENLATAPPPPLIGQTLGGKYRAIRVLGEGGMGAVYECEHIALHRRVAVKVLHPQQAKKKASVARFQNEAHVAGAIGHPNICEIYDVGELSDSSPFLVMELLQGETLAERIASEGALPFDDIIDVTSQVLSGLIAAHDKGIIHRDIKPENVFLTSRAGLPAMVKLLDFGISKVAGADELHLTKTGMVMGTPFYMSPEQARGDRNLDNRVDIYATGVMMYECLTGRRPFHASNYNALLMQILTTDPRPPQDLRPAVPEGFSKVLAKAMQRDREKRYQSASEFQRDVQLLRDPGTMRRMPSAPPEPLPLMTRSRRDEPLPPSSRNPPPKPSRELGAVSVNLESLLDSGALAADSGSLEIPIHTEAPISSKESRALYRPDPELEAISRSKSMPPPAAAAPPPPKPLKITPPPLPSPRQQMQAPPKPRERYKAPTPTSLDIRNSGPWHDHEHDADPTEIGSIFGKPRAPGLTPIDADSTERIPPERLARLEQLRSRDEHTPPQERLSTDRFDISHEKEDDEAPTTLFDRRALKKGLSKKGKSGPNPPVRGHTTERAPAPVQSAGPPPIPRLRGPKDR
jgi:eukaryotic-like serine/threonine-protein kinase